MKLVIDPPICISIILVLVIIVAYFVYEYVKNWNEDLKEETKDLFRSYFNYLDKKEKKK